MTDGSPLRKMLAGYDGRCPMRCPFERRTASNWSPSSGTPIHGARYRGILTCASCGKRVKKFYGQGFCFPCLQSAPEAAECIIRPELCRAHLGEGRDPDWERAHHMTEHAIYLSYTGGVKVGITRSTQVPVRWIDQGAVSALIIARVPYRQLSGLIEVDLKRLFADRTNWRAMLKLVPPDHAWPCVKHVP